MTYRLWWTVGYVCTTEQEFKAAKHRLLPATYEALDDALRRANQVFRAGGVVDPRLLHRIAGVAQADELHTLHDPAVLDVETGDDADLEHGHSPFSTRMASGTVTRPS